MRNIMLDFAQFEREMSAKRTRDKMLARARKGLWNGGLVSLLRLLSRRKEVKD